MSWVMGVVFTRRAVPWLSCWLLSCCTKELTLIDHIIKELTWPVILLGFLFLDEMSLLSSSQHLFLLSDEFKQVSWKGKDTSITTQFTRSYRNHKRYHLCMHNPNLVQQAILWHPIPLHIWASYIVSLPLLDGGKGREKRRKMIMLSLFG